MIEQSDPGTAATDDGDRANRRRRAARRAGLVGIAAVAVLGVLYGVDVLFSNGNVPRGVTVAGVQVGGMTRTAAEQKLREQIEPRLARPVGLKAGDVQATLEPGSAGLNLDWAGTLDRAGSQPLNPVTRITSFFTSREVGVATHADTTRLVAALDGLRARTDRDPTEGTVRFDGLNPVAVDPKQGQKLDVANSVPSVVADWASGRQVELPVVTTAVRTTKAVVDAALQQVAKPSVAGPVTITGEGGKTATLAPDAIAKALTFEPADGALNPKVDQGKVVEVVKPQLADTEKDGKDAAIVFESGKPAVKESVDGVGVDWDKSLAGLLDVLKRPDNRVVKAEYAHKPAKITTDAANQLGIKEVIGEFETGGFAADSGVNIRLVAEKVNGAIVKPGDTFSLNGFTGPRGTREGYVDAGIIENGAPGRAVGGGISQFATTLYNAAYFAGMKDAGHKEHSYWITRYPAGREATVFQNPDGSSVIDLKFTNDSPTGVAIQTIWTPSSLKVVLWGTKRYSSVESITGEKTNFVDPPTKQGPAQNCHAGNGAPGFTVTDTKVIKDLSGKEVSRNTRTVRYDPSPKIVCGQG
ncbi:vanomycin resistance protein VanB [Solihabitans fulvus]|uniref:Vanomycin resistance protein VanB n=1 Tax=Solihabitans fulvus TaxID=1892852 RepID=A0A5B2XKT4_9PSEU|nr:VanW family protein [Solihabitans fulvus]KAA2263491.1 vanomycin resistance protein VanB [Solihabitans fulvus]